MGTWGNHLGSSVCTNGKHVASLRKRIGLTQKQLAKIAGYSERLIRKAESDGSLSKLTIHDLAVALSNNGAPVQAEDLICSPESLAREFLSAFAEHEAEMAAQVEHFLDREFVLVCAGDPAKIPFAGQWHGVDGLDQWANTFFATLTRPENDFYKPTFFSNGNTVVAWGEDLVHVPEPTFRPIWVTQRFEFRQRKLIRFEHLFDTDGVSEHLASRKLTLC